MSKTTIIMPNSRRIRKAVYERLSDETYWGRKVTTEKIINITIAQVNKLGEANGKRLGLLK